MQRPSARQLDDRLAAAARGIAERIAGAGGRAWIVGGAPRDLALGMRPTEIDMATDLVPERVEALFTRTAAVGRAFGTVIVVGRVGEADSGGDDACGGVSTDVEVTTFRSESGDSDARRPDEVMYGTSVEEDAARRDFTCNALYLDPLTDDFRDPEHGLEDLAARRLRCVGDPRARFREDGLRILRLARFAARLGLDPERATLDAARAELDALRGVSAERVRVELERVLVGPAPAEAIELLVELGAHQRVLAGRLVGDAGRARIATLRALGPRCGVALGFAALFDPRPGATELEPDEIGTAEAGVEALRPSKALRRRVVRLLALQGDVARVAGGRARRAERLRLFRDADWSAAADLAAARGACDGGAAGRLRAEAAGLSDRDLRPAPLLDAEALVAAGVERGPRLGELLRALEDAQLEGDVTGMDGARRWLAAQLGGNQRRSDHETG